MKLRMKKTSELSVAASHRLICKLARRARRRRRMGVYQKCINKSMRLHLDAVLFEVDAKQE